jgi:hypothetical protein
MASICAAAVLGRTLRITKTNECGVPITGAESAQIVSEGFVSIELAPEYEDGEEFFQRTASGQACVNRQGPPTLKYIELTNDFCEVDPDIPVVVWGARLLTTSAPVSGSGFAIGEGTVNAHFSLEVWQEVAGEGACDPAGNQLYIYHAFPHVRNGMLGEYTIENGVSTLQYVAQSGAASPLWTVGSAYLDGNTVVFGDHWVYNITSVAPPVATCGAVTI